MIHPSIYSYIKAEESRFETEEVQIGDNWWWNFRNHVQLIFHLKHGVFFTGENNWLRSFKQVMLPLLRLSYWTEDIEVKDVIFFIENSAGRALSFLIKKYHDEVYVRENDLDTLFDEITETDIDYGGVLVQKTNTGRPEVKKFNAVAFCDQTDILGGPLFFKFSFSPDALRGMSKLGWGEEKNGATISLEELCVLAEYEKDIAGLGAGKAKTPGKNIEVYVGQGTLPEHFLLDNNEMEYHVNQVQVVAFYTSKDSNKEGVTLYRKKASEGNLKFHTSEDIYGRALGYSDGEAFLHPQVWSNCISIWKHNLLEAASKVPLMTDDPNFQNRNKIQDMENLEIMTISEGTKIPPQPIQTAAVANIQLYESSINELFEHAQLLGAAFDPILGKEGNAGTTFRGQERTVAQGRGWHDRRRGQRAKFIEELYRDWIIPDMVREITKGKKFLATLTAEELSWVADQLAENDVNARIKTKLIEGELITKEEQDELRNLFKQNFSKQGSKHLIEILKDEFDGVEIKMGINVAGKQKDLVNLSDKILSIFQFIFANPQGFQQAMQIPALARSFHDLLEFSGMNQVDFASLITPPQLQAPQPQPTQPQQPAQPIALNPAPADA